MLRDCAQNPPTSHSSKKQAVLQPFSSAFFVQQRKTEEIASKEFLQVESFQVVLPLVLMYLAKPLRKLKNYAACGYGATIWH